MQAPECLIIAGPNGGGRTTVYRHLVSRGKFPSNLDYVNVDDSLRELRLHAPSASEIAAGRMSLVRINDLIDRRGSFVFETTLSSQHSLRVMKRARQEGYHIGLIFVLLRNVELHVARPGGVACCTGRAFRGGRSNSAALCHGTADLCFSMRGM